jgi:hypothetical protein
VKKQTSIVLAGFLLVGGARAFAQQNGADQAGRQAEAVARAAQKVAEEAKQADEARAAAVNPVDVEVVIARYQGEKKLSSLPYTLSVTPTPNRAPTRLRMGGAVPMPSMAPPIGPDGKPVGPVVAGGPVQYMDVGTNIDSGVRQLPDGRFEVFVSVEDKWVVTAAQTPSAISALPFVRSFQTSNTLVMRDGQTRQFTAAADRVTGEIIKVEVTLKVVK